jgi:hypothetical protein
LVLLVEGKEVLKISYMPIAFNERKHVCQNDLVLETVPHQKNDKECVEHLYEYVL